MDPLLLIWLYKIKLFLIYVNIFANSSIKIIIKIDMKILKDISYLADAFLIFLLSLLI